MSDSWGEYLLSQEAYSFQGEALRVPETIELDNGQLLWNPSGTYKTVELNKELIQKFAGLAVAESEGILRFARQWGVLGLCKHKLPATHNPPSFLLTSNESEECQPLGNEPIEVWHKFARISRAMLSISAQLQQERNANENDWLVLMQGAPEGNLPKDIESEKNLLERSVNVWLDLSGIRPRLKHDDSEIQLSYPSSGSLFCVLTIQLMSLVSGRDSLLKCSGCGVVGSYKELGSGRFRRPKAGASFYCDDCRLDEVPQRLAAKASKQRKKIKM